MIIGWGTAVGRPLYIPHFILVLTDEWLPKYTGQDDMDLTSPYLREELSAGSPTGTPAAFSLPWWQEDAAPEDNEYLNGDTFYEVLNHFLSLPSIKMEPISDPAAEFAVYSNHVAADLQQAPLACIQQLRNLEQAMVDQAALMSRRSAGYDQLFTAALQKETRSRNTATFSPGIPADYMATPFVSHPGPMTKMYSKPRSMLAST